MIPIIITSVLSKIPWKIVGIVAIVAYIFIMTSMYFSMKKEFIRVSSNQEVILSQINNKVDLNKQLTLTPEEFKRTLDSTTKKIMEDNNLRVKNLEHLIKGTIHADGTIVTVPRDTFIIRNDTLIPAKGFAKSTKYLTIDGLITTDSVTVNWSTWDNIRLLLYWKREGKFLPKIFGKKAYRADIKGENPYIKYVVDQNIKISKE